MSINYFYSSNNVDADKRSSIAMMWSIHTRFGNIFNGKRCFEGKLYQAPPRCVAYALQEPFKEELK